MPKMDNLCINCGQPAIAAFGFRYCSGQCIAEFEKMRKLRRELVMPHRENEWDTL